MIDFGCFMYLCVCSSLILWSLLIASRFGHPAWLGLVTGLIACLAAISGHGSFLSIVDWFQKSRYPNRIGVPRWAIALIWFIFITAVAGSALLFRRLSTPPA
jgi:hypothetical protein